jgi:hypothetical protein
VSVPFQFNWGQGVGPDDQTRFLLNVQPVMPFGISRDWNMIARVITPLVSQPPLVEGGTPVFGISDITASFFFTPAAPERFIWAVGPVFTVPSTTIPTLGSEKWSLGPTALLLKQQGPLTYGVLWNQVWSYGGNDNRADVNQMFIQPFFAYTTKTAVTYTVNSESSANWDADEKWTVPINFSVAKLSSFGTFPASYQIGLGVFATSPADGGADWKLRAGMTILLPRRKSTTSLPQPRRRSSEDNLCDADDQIFERQDRQTQWQQWSGGRHCKQYHIVQPKRHDAHLANDRITVREVRQRLDIGSPQQLSAVGWVSPHPLFFEFLHVSTGQESVCAQTFAFHVRQMRRKHDERAEHNQDEEHDEAGGFHFEGQQVLTFVEDAIRNHAGQQTALRKHDRTKGVSALAQEAETPSTIRVSGRKVERQT